MKKSPNQLRPFLSMAYYALRAQLRNRATFAFGFLFPIVFISIFGLIGGGLNISIGIPQNQQIGPVYLALKEIEAVRIESAAQEELNRKLEQGRLAGILLLGEDQPRLLVSQATPAQATATQSLVSGVVNQLNLEISGIKDPPIKLKVEEISGRKFRYIDFALPGLIGFAMLATAVTGTGFGLIFLKKTLVLKRIFATPVKGSTILLGQGASRLIVVLAQTLVILAIGVFVYNFQLINGLLTLIQILILSAVGLIAFLGFGLLVAGLSNDENTVAPLANLITIPQLLVSGTFFSTDLLPNWSQPIANNLPLAFFNTAIRKITIEAASFDQVAPQLLGLAVWSVAAYIIAARTFKWT